LDVTCIDLYETNTKKAAIEAAMKKILLVDSSKFDKICPVTFSTLQEFDTIITDKNLSEEWKNYINNLGIELLMVQP
ncbi:MAG: DeoR/GlpR transcriptional regulator, partial [Christensenellaceae bacterium]